MAQSQQVLFVDDVVGLFAVLMPSKLIGSTIWAAVTVQMQLLPSLRRAPVTSPSATKVLLEVAEQGEQIDTAAEWERLRAEGMRERFMGAVQAVGELSPFGEVDPTYWVFD